MSVTALRWVFAAMMCIALFSITLPLRAATPVPQQQTMRCCADHNTTKTQHHCNHQMPQPQDDHCCAACAVGLALFVTPQPAFIFSPPQGEEFIRFATHNTTRSERPPVPPPRAI